MVPFGQDLHMVDQSLKTVAQRTFSRPSLEPPAGFSGSTSLPRELALLSRKIGMAGGIAWKSDEFGW